MSGTYFIGVGTPHNIYRKSLAVGGWMGGWGVVQTRKYHFVAPSCKLKLARFSARPRIQDGARVWQYTWFCIILCTYAQILCLFRFLILSLKLCNLILDFVEHFLWSAIMTNLILCCYHHIFIHGHGMHIFAQQIWISAPDLCKFLWCVQGFIN